METYEYRRICNISERKYDVVVVGGGTAGATAAISSAMEGASTLVIESRSFFGGSSSGGQVTPMMHAGIPGNRDSSFVNTMVKKRLIEEGYGAEDPYENDGYANPEMLKFTLEEIYRSYGGDILYETQFIDTIVENGSMEGIVVKNLSGIQVIKGRVFIDCTGDAEAAYSSGVPCFTGDEKENKNQALSLRFMAGNIDIKKVQDYLKDLGEPMVLEYPFIEISSVWEKDSPLNSIFKRALADGVIEYEDGKYFQAFSVPGMPGVMSFNCPEIPGIYDVFSPGSISNSLVTGRIMIKRLHHFLKTYLPGFEESYILSTASMPGIRESRRIKGKYLLTEMDYLNRVKFDDAIARTAYPIDIHGLIDENKLGLEPIKRGEYFEIPFRCLVPENINNLLVAGRCISSTFIAQSSIRIQPTCRATGEAAGIAAALCAGSGKKTRDFDGRIVRSIMIERGAYL